MPLSNRRFLIRVDGDKQIGMGHAVRMRHLAEALRARDAETLFVSRAGTPAFDLFCKAGLPVQPAPGDDEATNLVELCDDWAAHTVIFDLFDPKRDLVSGLKKSCRVVAFDAWSAPVLSRADAVINAIVFMYGRYEPHHVTGRLYEGPAYMILDPAIGALAPSVFKKDVSRIFVALGGADTHDSTASVIAALSEIDRPIELRVNLGPAAQETPALARAAAASPHAIAILKGVPSMGDELRAADLAVIGGGILLYEAARLGVPTAALASDDHELLNIDYWKSQGTAELLGDGRRLDKSAAANTLCSLIDDSEKRRRMASQGPALVDGRGLDRCLEILAA